MRIVDLARNDGRAGSERSWRSKSYQDNDGVMIREIMHYSTLMLKFRVIVPDDPDYLDYHIGHGSVSDQSGMNQLFRELGLPYYYSRLGGAEISMVLAHPVMS